jgi:hypothetical protein
MSASSLLKMQSPRKNFGNVITLANKFSALAPRDVSPAPAPDTPGGRSRSNSIKRKNPEGQSFAEIAALGTGAGIRYEQNTESSREKDEINLEIGKVQSICEKVAVDIGNADLDPTITMIFGGLCEAMQGICKVQQRLNASTTGTVSGSGTGAVTCGTGMQTGREAPIMVDLGTLPKKPRHGSALSQPQAQAPPVLRATPGLTVTNSGQDAVTTDPVKKFKEAIKEAERSTLIFNLDMGKVPVLNKETMSRRATLALTTMAAQKEKRPGSIPSSEAVEAIDDVLSIVKDMTLYGNETRTYKKHGDARSGGFCTVPVKYEFRDRDVKAKAEKVLRKYCDVQCSTPYPPMVRECIKQIVAECKKDYPNNFIRVTVDVNNMLFKVTRNAPDTAESPGWHSRDADIPIPPEALDLGLKKAPLGFKLHIPPSPPKKDRAERRASENDITMSQPEEAATQSG